MNIIVGASGRVGSALVKELSKRGMSVTAVVRNADKAGMFGHGIQVRVADIFDADALAKAMEGGDTVFLMTPESMHSENVMADADKLIGNYRKAITGSGIRRLVGLSSIGAHIGEGSGNLYVSHKLEKAFTDLPVQATFIRPAYYYSNWLAYWDMVQEHGILPTFFDPDQKIIMVSPGDVAQFAAVVIRSGALTAPVYEISGPAAYSSNDVARTFGQFLNRKVNVLHIPREEWIPTLTNAGFSEDAARNMALMTETVVNTTTFSEHPENLILWNTDMEEYFEQQR